MNAGHNGNAQIDIALLDVRFKAAFLWDAAFGDVHITEDFQP